MGNNDDGSPLSLAMDSVQNPESERMSVQVLIIAPNS